MLADNIAFVNFEDDSDKFKHIVNIELYIYD